MIAWVIALAVVGAAAEAQPRLGCDPYSWEQPVEAAAGRGMQCGDGRVGSYDSCMQSCAGGCEGVSGCSEPRCVTAREVCDGRDLGGASCRSLGFAGGTLACDASCTGHDVSGCGLCFAGGGVTCGETRLAERITDVRAVGGAEGALVIVTSDAGLRWAIAGRDLSVQGWSEGIAARAFDAIAIDGGWVLGIAGAGAGAGVTLLRIDARGVASVIEALPAATEVALWAVRGGGVIVTTGTAFGAPFRTLDARGASAALAVPAHATRPDGARMLVLDPQGQREMSDAASSMRVEWDARPGDRVIAFVLRGTSGAQIVRDGVILRGMGTVGGGDAVGSIEVHLGAVPQRSGSTDPVWQAAVPDELPAPASGWIRMAIARGRTRDSFEPRGGRAFAVAGAVPRDPTRARVLVDHPSIAVRRFFADGRGVAAAALAYDADGGTRIVLARSRR